MHTKEGRRQHIYRFLARLTKSTLACLLGVRQKSSTKEQKGQRETESWKRERERERDKKAERERLRLRKREKREGQKS
jgi:hypothetical protein